MVAGEIQTPQTHKQLTRSEALCYDAPRAEVVELADTLGSGSSGLTPVGVQIPPSAPILPHLSLPSKDRFPLVSSLDCS